MSKEHAIEKCKLIAKSFTKHFSTDRQETTNEAIACGLAHYQTYLQYTQNISLEQFIGPRVWYSLLEWHRKNRRWQQHNPTISDSIYQVEDKSITLEERFSCLSKESLHIVDMILLLTEELIHTFFKKKQGRRKKIEAVHKLLQSKGMDNNTITLAFREIKEVFSS